MSQLISILLLEQLTPKYSPCLPTTKPHPHKQATCVRQLPCQLQCLTNQPSSFVQLLRHPAWGLGGSWRHCQSGSSAQDSGQTSEEACVLSQCLRHVLSGGYDDGTLFVVSKLQVFPGVITTNGNSHTSFSLHLAGSWAALSTAAAFLTPSLSCLRSWALSVFRYPSGGCSDGEDKVALSSTRICKKVQEVLVQVTSGACWSGTRTITRTSIDEDEEGCASPSFFLSN